MFREAWELTMDILSMLATVALTVVLTAFFIGAFVFVSTAVGIVILALIKGCA